MKKGDLVKKRMVTLVLIQLMGLGVYAGDLSDCISGVVTMQKQVDPKTPDKSAYEVAGVACSSGGKADRALECLKGFTAKTKVGWLVAAHACSGGSDSISALKCFEKVKPNMGNSNDAAAKLCSFGTDGNKAVECINKMATKNYGWEVAQYACRGNNDGDVAARCVAATWNNFNMSTMAAGIACGFGNTPDKINECKTAFYRNYSGGMATPETAEAAAWACVGGTDGRTMKACVEGAVDAIGKGYSIAKVCGFGNNLRRVQACASEVKVLGKASVSDVAFVCQNYNWKPEVERATLPPASRDSNRGF